MKKIKLSFIGKLIVIALFSLQNLKAQTPNSVGIGTSNPHPSAILHLEANRQGFLMPRLTTGQVNSIASPTVGLIVYNLTDNCYWYKRPTYWAKLCDTDSINALSVITNTFTADSALINYLTVNNLNADSIFASYINTNFFYGDSVYANYLNFNNAYGDSIFVHYLKADTAIIHQLTVNNIKGDSAFFNYANVNILNTDTIYNNYLTSKTIKTDSLYLGGKAITTVITDSITNLAWLLKGNSATNPTTNFLGTKDNQHLVLRTNNTEKMRVLSTGEVGIGVFAPTNKLEVAGNTKTTNFQMTAGASNSLIMVSDNTGNGTWQNISSVLTTTALNGSAWTLLGNTLTNPAINFLGTSDNQHLVLRTNNTEKLRVLSTGEVGIGVLVPTNKLEVAGNIKTTNFQMTAGASNSLIMVSNALGNGTWQNISSVLTPSALNGSAWTLLGNTLTNPAINFLGTSDNQHLVFRTNNTEKMRVLSTGEVGIGVLAPTNKLEVAGNTKTTNFQMTAGASNSLIMVSDNSGNGTWQNISSVLTPSALNGSGWSLLGNSGTNQGTNFLGTTDLTGLVFKTSNIEQMRISAGGNIGMGVTAPTNKLEVAGNTKTTNFQMTAGASNSLIMVSNALGNGTWQNISSVLTPSALNGSAWTLLGNSGTNASVNFVGTTDSVDLTFRTANQTKFVMNKYGSFISNFNGTLTNPVINLNAGSGIYHNSGKGLTVISSPNALAYEFAHFGNNIEFIPGSALLGQTNNTVNAFNSVVYGEGNYLAGSGNYPHNNYVSGLNNVLNTVNSSVYYNNIIDGFSNSIDDNGGNSKSNLISGSNNTITTTGAVSFNNYAYGRNNVITNSYDGYIFGNNNRVLNPTGANLFIIGSDNISNATQNSYLFGSGLKQSFRNTVSIGVSSLGFESGFANNGVSIIGSGGTRIFSNGILTTGVSLAPGGGAWASISDKRLKENITEIKPRTILEKLLSVTVTEWNYITQKVDTMNKYAPKGMHYDKAPVHIGPMAQDFSEIFGYGEYNDKITTSDIDGVMFVSIQALALDNKELKDSNKELLQALKKQASDIEELKKIINEIKNR